VVRSNKQRDKLHVSKARLGSIGVQLNQQLGWGLLPKYLIIVTDEYIAMLKVTGSLQKSTEIMKLSNQLIKLPEIGQAMREMSMEMTKVGTTPY
jgi:charged multivesicular body protein 3